ncbi:hypothetical protein MHBO_002931 [Bonamia ostreae]|uniref:Uncharacterized protein n=1 Tax=Bonamia ostreae TaxID=126728 RepID=A0ABV2ANZ5_9EUKA
MKAFSRLKPNSTKKIKIEGFINLTSDSIDDTTNGNIEKYFDQNILPRFMPLHSISGLVGVGENAQKMIV